MISKYSAVILAAGNSSRMGVPKWSLKYDENFNFAEKIAHEFNVAGANDIALVVNAQSYEEIEKSELKFPNNLKLIKNENPEFGRFYSLKKGVEICDSDEHVCFTNIDNPFINLKILDVILGGKADYDLICPSYQEKGGHPLLISEKVIRDIVNESTINLTLRDFLKKYDKQKIEVEDSKVLININTPEEYAHYFSLP